ncbi:MAG: DNA polymerase III subunit delta [Firmicutes bacterium]|nr:DNA polymerase III subunit delta [Bacillota bacterium]
MEKNRYLLYGTDHYCIKNKTLSILNLHNISLECAEFYDMDESLLDEAITSAMTIPFLDEKKAVVISNASFLSQNKSPKELNHQFDLFLSYWNNPNPTTVLIIQAPYERLDSRKNLVKIIQDQAEVTICQKNESEDLYALIKDILKEKEKTIDANALQLFVSRTSYDKTLMMNELDKVLMYIDKDTKIDISIIREVVSRNLEDNIYQLVNAVLSQDGRTIMSIYQDLIKINTEPMWMIGVIVNKFQEILYTKELIHLNYQFEDIMKYFSVTKGRAYYMVKNAKEVEDQMLMRYLSQLEMLDYQIKSGQIDKRIGLELFLLKINK